MSGATGHIDTYSWEFDGVDDYVEVGSSSLSALDGLTVSAWVYPHTATSGHIAGVDESGGQSWNLELINGIPSFKVYDSAAYYTTVSPNALTLNTWNHVLGTLTVQQQPTPYLSIQFKREHPIHYQHQIHYHLEM